MERREQAGRNHWWKGKNKPQDEKDLDRQDFSKIIAQRINGEDRKKKILKWKKIITKDGEDIKRENESGLKTHSF